MKAGELLVFDMILNIPQDLPPLKGNSVLLWADGIELKDKGQPVVVGVILWDNSGKGGKAQWLNKGALEFLQLVCCYKSF